jgi:glycosyltransferase involved in cell wall biosynthesis
MIRSGARRADAIVCVSDFTAYRLAAHTRSRGPVTVVRHGVDHQRFHSDGDRDADLAALARHGIRPPYVAFVGTLEPRKDVLTLVVAFAALAADHPDLQLALVGRDGWGVDPIRDAIAASGFASRIVRTGYVEDAVVPAVYRRAAAVAYPSFEEGFGLTALEAMACGAPLVTTADSALAEVAAGASRTVPVHDARALEGRASGVAGPRQRGRRGIAASRAAASARVHVGGIGGRPCRGVPAGRGGSADLRALAFIAVPSPKMQYAMVAMIADDEFIARYRLDPSRTAQVGDRGVRNIGQHPEKTEIEVG